MRYLLACLIVILPATSRPAAAATITWFASGEVFSVSDNFNFWPGLTAGTPWSLTFTLDPAAPPSRPAINPPDCNFYAMGSSTLTLGSFTYTNGGGRVATNFAHPGGCTGSVAPSDPDGLITFLYLEDWQQEPGAWNLNIDSITYFSYYDLLATDGGLPLFPMINPNPGLYGGAEHEALQNSASFNLGAFVPTAVSQPAPVPEPATLTMLGLGLAALAARKKRR